MELVMNNERNYGREPEDVSQQKRGFDIISRGKDEVRYILVKASADEGPVRISLAEMSVAKRLKEQYWLYNVLNISKNPELKLVNNPAGNLNQNETDSS